ncbi:site-specific DNA-methyltransferase [Starkeya sp. 3C]|uniref:site-specific DNA-methyltransferase (cytosine-N(4)-specific) n=1 Tax=Ancylobacter moscoviensis TaxID=2597768 RepID=A0ABY3DNH8_9HYPH|nr:site-specific DNA-methyltransferase [Ancylobacter moscoviensis]TSJ60811.1 site-specific DNA-methyltransferase [Ancylobacter moscoviensis]
MKVRSIHPFPARMAPDLALVSMEDLPAGSVVLDPMVGSGTVVRHATELGHEALGFDMDPLAVLMSRAWTTSVSDVAIDTELKIVLEQVEELGSTVPTLPWQQDLDTLRFVDYWFHKNQRGDLARLASVLDRRKAAVQEETGDSALTVLIVAFSRIIITKEQGASLARDTSHSRPHRVATQSEYQVIPNFVRSVAQLRKRLIEHPPTGSANIHHGDARSLQIADGTVDAVVTSPPYLNAIDYMRGHRMSLVWLGHSIPELKAVRSTSIGAERASGATVSRDVVSVIASMRGTELLTRRLEGIVTRYAVDLLAMTSETARVLKPGGRATFVVGNSCIKGRFIDNAAGLATAALTAGLLVKQSRERNLPAASRYLPVSGDSLSKRMRTETVLICRKPDVSA